MSVYNGDIYLDDCIQSILNQTFKDFEFLIINDGSTDNTKNIIEKYRETDDRIRLVNQNNIGLTKSLIKGVDLCKSNYIARQDADDLSVENRLERQYIELKRDRKLGVIGTNAYIIDEKAKIIKKTNLRCRNFWLRKEIIFGNCFIHGSVMFKKNFYIDAGGYNKQYHCAQDFDLWTRMSELCEIKNTKASYYYLRKHKNSISFIRKKKQNTAVVNILHKRNKKNNLFFLNYIHTKCKKHIELRLLLKQKDFNIIKKYDNNLLSNYSIYYKIDFLLIRIIIKFLKSD